MPPRNCAGCARNRRRSSRAAPGQQVHVVARRDRCEEIAGDELCPLGDAGLDERRLGSTPPPPANRGLRPSSSGCDDRSYASSGPVLPPTSSTRHAARRSSTSSIMSACSAAHGHRIVEHVGGVRMDHEIRRRSRRRGSPRSDRCRHELRRQCARTTPWPTATRASAPSRSSRRTASANGSPDWHGSGRAGHAAGILDARYASSRSNAAASQPVAVAGSTAVLERWSRSGKFQLDQRAEQGARRVRPAAAPSRPASERETVSSAPPAPAQARGSAHGRDRRNRRNAGLFPKRQRPCSRGSHTTRPTIGSRRTSWFITSSHSARRSLRINTYAGSSNRFTNSPGSSCRSYSSPTGSSR